MITIVYKLSKIRHLRTFFALTFSHPFFTAQRHGGQRNQGEMIILPPFPYLSLSSLCSSPCSSRSRSLRHSPTPKHPTHRSFHSFSFPSPRLRLIAASPSSSPRLVAPVAAAFAPHRRRNISDAPLRGTTLSALQSAANGGN